MIKREPGIRAKSASLPKAFVKAGGAVPDLMGITAVFSEPKGNCLRDTYTHFPSRLHESRGADERAVPKPTLFKIFSGLSQGLSPAKLAPFIDNMHTALWVLAATSLIGAAVSLMRPRHQEAPAPGALAAEVAR